MRVLITGASGFVGPHLAAELEGAGYEVYTTGLHETAPFTQYKPANLTDAESVSALIEWARPEAIVHLAGMAAVGPSFAAPLKYVQVNMGSEITLFEELLARKMFPRVLVVSSGSLYDPEGELPLRETSPVKPTSPYAVSKLGQEQLALYYSLRGFETVIARPFNHIGPGQEPGFILPDLVSQIVPLEKSGGTISVGNLEAKRDYTDVRDIVRAYRMLLEGGESGEIYNICSGRSLSGRELLDALLAQVDAKIAVIQDPAKMRPADNPVITGDRSKLSEATGWEPEIAIEDTLRDTLEDWHGRAR